MTLKPWRQIITPHEDILLDKNVPRSKVSDGVRTRDYFGYADGKPCETNLAAA